MVVATRGSAATRTRINRGAGDNGGGGGIRRTTTLRGTGPRFRQPRSVDFVPNSRLSDVLARMGVESIDGHSIRQGGMAIQLDSIVEPDADLEAIPRNGAG